MAIFPIILILEEQISVESLVIKSWFMFGHELHKYLLYFKVFFIIQHVFSVKGGDTLSSLYEGGENFQLHGRTMVKIR